MKKTRIANAVQQAVINNVYHRAYVEQERMERQQTEALRKYIEKTN